MRRLEVGVAVLGFLLFGRAGAQPQPPAKRSLAELVNVSEPAWPDVKSWAGKRAKILSATRADGERTLLALQVTARSPMGAVALESCGILVDGGWLRILGAGCPQMTGNLLTWNDGGRPGLLIVAHDVLGGLFAINGGALPGKPGNICYFGPDSLSWADLEMSYSQFLHAALTGALGPFLADLRWRDWKKDVAKVGPDQALSLYPPLWSVEGQKKDAKVSRKVVPLKELVDLHMHTAKSLDAAR